MKKVALLSLLSCMVFILACGGGDTKDTKVSGTTSANSPDDEKRGVGKFTKVDIPATLNKEMAETGKKIAESKCVSCHKLTAEKLVGPGWLGVTKRRTPEWIMNFATNTEEMLSKNAEAQSMLEICLVRMPNQNLSDDDARHVYEFMRMNDGVQ